MTNKEREDKAVIENEELGRKIFTEVCDREKWCRVHKYSKDRYQSWDVSFYDNTQTVVGELKKRKYKSSAFYDWYFEVEKADKLIEIAKKTKDKTGLTPLIGYINLFDDNFMWVWTFTPEELAKLPTSTELLQKNDWSDEKEWKKVYRLTSAQAQRKEEINLNLSIFNNKNQ